MTKPLKKQRIVDLHI